MAKLIKGICGRNRIACRIVYAGGHDQDIIRVFIQMVIRFGKQRQAGRVPDNLVYADHLRLKVFKLILAQAASGQLDQENRVAVHGSHINGAIKRNREPWLEIESIKLV